VDVRHSQHVQHAGQPRRVLELAHSVRFQRQAGVVEDARRELHSPLHGEASDEAFVLLLLHIALSIMILGFPHYFTCAPPVKWE